MDTVDQGTRSRMMSGIRGQNTGPEIFIRKMLFAEGFRFRIHRKDLPGRPDIVLPRYHAAIQVNGCFWHGHSDCHLYRLPKSRSDFWHKKISSNIERDRRNLKELCNLGWRTLVVWECAMKGRSQLEYEPLKQYIVAFVLGDMPSALIRGHLNS